MIIPTKAIIAATLIGGGLFSFIYWRAHAHRPKTTNGVIIFDNSASTLDDPAILVGLIERAIQQPKLSRRSTLTLLATGDGRTGNEPRLITKYDVPSYRRSFEGKKSIAQRRAQLLSDLKE